MNCCDESGDCKKNRKCSDRVAKIGQRMIGPDPLPNSVWRYQVKRLAYWLLLAFAGMTIWPLLMYVVLLA